MTLTPCPCSGLPYDACCKPYHEGKHPENALILMRSRFSAYALNLPEYIIKTTHPACPQYNLDKSSWANQISQFSQNTVFERLEVLDFKEHGSLAIVTFVAHLSQHGENITFTERSYFEKLKDVWLYRHGQLQEGRAPNLITAQIRLLPLAYYDDPILRRKADPITEITDDLRTLITEMIDTMDACNGLGLAAPQIHHSIRLFIIRIPIETPNGLELGDYKVFINPEISNPSSNTWKASEGCLSIPSIHGDVERPHEITIEYTNLNGERIKEQVAGWQARVIMHENDHINGVLFIDHLTQTDKTAVQPFLDHLIKRISDGPEL